MAHSELKTTFKKYMRTTFLITIMIGCVGAPAFTLAATTTECKEDRGCVSPEAKIATTLIAPKDKSPEITGTAEGVKKVYVRVYKKGSTKAYYSSKSLAVKNEKWKAQLKKKISLGTYQVEVVVDTNKKTKALATSTLLVQNKAVPQTKKVSTLAVLPVPLLFGGTTRAGESVSVAYIQVVNIGKEATTLQGFTVSQNGSAPESSLTGLTVVDDSGLFRGATVSNSGESLFKNGLATVPIIVPFEPGQTRLFTIKAVLGNDSTSLAGTQLMIDLEGVSAEASVQGAFPQRGTTWTIGL